MKAYLHTVDVRTTIEIITTDRDPSYSAIQDEARSVIEDAPSQELDCEVTGIAQPIDTEDYE